MANIDVNALQRSELDRFLFADVGVEASGMTLSVLSTLARRGIDPWQEAGRLAKMPRTDAADGLARIIAAMPASLWPLPAATAIATRLVALLPARSGAASVATLALPEDVASIPVWVRSLLPAGGDRPKQPGSPAFRALLQRAVVLALVGAVLGGLVLNLAGKPGLVSHGGAAAHSSAPSSSSAAIPADHTTPGK